MVSLIIFVTFVLVIDIYAFRGIKVLTAGTRPLVSQVLHFLFWLTPVITIGGMLIMGLFRHRLHDPAVFIRMFWFVGFMVLFYLPKLVFVLFQLAGDISHLIAWVGSLFMPKQEPALAIADKISRTEFLSRIGIIVAVIPFVSVLHGIARGKFNYQIARHTLRFSSLPKPFHGLRVAHISDLHIGSFIGHENQVEKAISLINAEKPDLILFTGDLVNNVAAEVKPFIGALSNLKARLGKFSVLGNHDYGDYMEWASLQNKADNLEKLKQYHADAGFKLLLNDSVKISSSDHQIGIAGVENWGLPPFPQYGNLNQTLKEISTMPFNILLSHDPSHWDAEVLGKTNVDLTLSGHTHGMQFGVSIPGWRWSPVKVKYPRWGGLYSEGLQKLYVSTGIGFIGFPGRVGMPPEIALLTLEREG